MNKMERDAAVVSSDPIEQPGDEVRPEPSDSGETDDATTNNAQVAVMRFVGKLKESRVEKGLRIEEISERSGLSVNALSRLENFQQLNPRVDTLCRYALAIGEELSMMSEPIDPQYL